jgi:multidrug transporter EmrE-like cation transporter
VKHWLYLALAIVAEVVATTSLKASDGFPKPGPSLLVVLGYGLAFYFMSQTIKVIPVGTGLSCAPRGGRAIGSPDALQPHRRLR